MSNRAHKNFRWQPHATSTPLKPNLSENKCKTFFQAEVINPSQELIKVLLSKSHETDYSDQNKLKSCKNKASIYFDVSSSSDEEDCNVNNKKIEIKINETRGIKIKELEKGKILDTNLITPKRSKNFGNGIESLKKADSKAKSFSSFANLNKMKNKSVQKNVTLNINSNKKNDCTAPCGQFLSKVNINAQINEDAEIKSKATENYLRKPTNKTEKHNIPSVKGNCKSHSNNSLNCQSNSHGNAKDFKPILTNETGASRFANECVAHSVFMEINNDKKTLSNSCNFDENLGKSKKVATKCKYQRMINDSIPEKKIKKDTCERKNSSHQLFSDSMEQELLNSLDLTMIDSNDKQNNLSSQKQSCKITEANNVKVEVKSRAGSKEAYSEETKQKHSSLVKDHINNCGFENIEEMKNRNCRPSSNNQHKIKFPILEKSVKNTVLKNDSCSIIKNNEKSADERAKEKLVLENLEIIPQNKSEVEGKNKSDFPINIQTEPEKDTQLNKGVKRNIENLKIKESRSKNKYKSADLKKFATLNSSLGQGSFSYMLLSFPNFFFLK